MTKAILLVGLGGGVGSILRYLTSVVATKYFQSNFPLGTFAVNVLGCLIIGILIGLFDKQQLANPDLRLLFITGFCGGFTTFSAASVEAAQLVLGQGSRTTRSQPSAVRVLKGAGLAATMLLLAVAAGALGLVLG